LKRPEGRFWPRARRRAATEARQKIGYRLAGEAEIQPPLRGRDDASPSDGAGQGEPKLSLRARDIFSAESGRRAGAAWELRAATNLATLLASKKPSSDKGAHRAHHAFRTITKGAFDTPYRLIKAEIDADRELRLAILAFIPEMPRFVRQQRGANIFARQTGGE